MRHRALSPSAEAIRSMPEVFTAKNILVNDYFGSGQISGRWWVVSEACQANASEGGHGGDEYGWGMNEGSRG